MTILGASATSLPLAETILSMWISRAGDEHRDDQQEDEEIGRAR